MSMKSRSGSALVEAAFIFPIVIACVTAVICIVIGLYSSLELQADIHNDLRIASGEHSKTVYRPYQTVDFSSTADTAGLRPVIRMEAEREHQVISLFHQRLMRKEAGRSYIVNEAELIRLLPSESEEP